MPLKLLAACAVVVGLGVVLGIGIIIAPEIDERVGFLTVRATKTIQSYQVNGVPLHDLVYTKFKEAQWRAYHQDVVWQTFVECVGKPRSGGPQQRLLWWVDERPRWNHGRWSLTVTVRTAVNNEALTLTPQLDDISAIIAPDPWQQGHARTASPALSR
jgi:hypothetical protein